MKLTRTPWYRSFFTYVWIFNTGRGLAVCIRLPNNVGLLYDLGCSEDFSPAGFVARLIVPKLSRWEKKPIAQCFLSHPHADHIWEIDALNGQGGKPPLLDAHLVTCPNDKELASAVDFSRIENEDNRDLLTRYRKTYATRHLPLRTLGATLSCNVPNVEYGFYYLSPLQAGRLHPSNDNQYGNALSIVLYLRHGNQSILIPGDITPEAFSEVLACRANVERRYSYFGATPAGLPVDIDQRTSRQPMLRDLLGSRGLSILVAPHHGLESGYCAALYEATRGGIPDLTVISEKRHLSEVDGRVDGRYQCSDGARGLPVDIDGAKENCWSVSTRNGHHILLVFRGTDAAPSVYLRSKPEELLEI